MTSPREKVNYHEDVKDELAKELAAFAAEGIAVEGVIDKKPTERKKIVHRTKSAGSSSSRVVRDTTKLKESSEKRHKQVAKDDLDLVVKDPALLKHHHSRSSSTAKKLKEQEAFQKDKKEWEAQKQLFLDEFNKERDDLNKKILALENKEEELALVVEDLVSQLNNVKIRKNNREDLYFKEIEELKLSLAKFEKEEQDENESVTTLWPTPITFDLKTGNSIDIRGEWLGESAGGSFNNITWRHNPNIFLFVNKTSTIKFSLFQPEQEKMHHMSFYVFKTYNSVGRRQIKTVPESDIICEAYYSSLRPNKVTVSAELPASQCPYIIMPACFYPGNESQFIMRIISSEDVSARLISAADEWPCCEGKWEGRYAGGCTNNPSFIDNHQYLSNVTKSTTLKFHLFQSAKVEFDSIGLYCIKADQGQSQKIEVYKQGNTISYVEFRNAFEATMEVKLEPGEYIIVPTTFHPGKESSFQLRVLFQEETQPFKPLTYLRDLHWISTKASWKSENAGGSINEPSQWRKNVQYTFSIPRDCKISLFLEQSHDQPNSKLFGIGWVLYASDKKISDIHNEAVSSPEYRPNKKLFTTISLKKGSYVIVPSTFEAGQYCDYELKMSSPDLFVSEAITFSVI